MLFQVGAHDNRLSDHGDDAVNRRSASLSLGAKDADYQEYAQYYFSHSVLLFVAHQKNGENTKKKKTNAFFFNFYNPLFLDYFLPRLSSDTVSFFLPLALRAASTLRPFAVDILSLNPCLCLRLVFEG
jgi:hypothetical protein